VIKYLEPLPGRFWPDGDGALKRLFDSKKGLVLINTGAIIKRATVKVAAADNAVHTVSITA
jgi:hypothetical protein